MRLGEISPAELVAATIARIERLNPALNAVTVPLFDEALAAARQPIPEGPFRGVPFMIKDALAKLAGAPMTWGSRLAGSYRCDHDSELVTRYRRAGLLIVGKTNTSEFGLTPTTEPVRFGPTRNPWSSSHSVGGSSGGSAAAVAARMVAAAHGNDGGGSIRIPAACCGLFGLKPTRARNPLGPDQGDVLSGLVCEHVLTRSVRDSAALLDISAGPGLGDPYCAPPQLQPFLDAVGASTGPLRIGLCAELEDGPPLDSACEAALQRAAKLCTELGHQVEPVALPFAFAELVDHFSLVWAVGCAQGVRAVANLVGREPNPELLEPLTWALYERGNQVSAPRYLLTLGALQRASRKLAESFQTWDALVTPTLAWPTPAIGTFAGSAEQPLQGFERAIDFVPYTPLANITGQPAMSVPMGTDNAGLPLGVHFIGRFGGEATLLALAAQLEQAAPWDRPPPVLSGC